MYDSTWVTLKTREEQQQMPPKLLFYHSTKTPLNPYTPKTQNSHQQKIRNKATRKTKKRYYLEEF